MSDGVRVRVSLPTAPVYTPSVPSAHASSHAAGHSDAISPASIGADPAGSAAAAQAAAIAACPAETTTTIGNLIAGAAAKTAPVSADKLCISDSAASNLLKQISPSSLLDLLASVGATKILRFPTWPAGAGFLLPALAASGNQASRSGGVVTINATAHGIPTTLYNGFRIFYPGSASLAAGWYDSITSITTNTILFTAAGADFGLENVNGGNPYTTTTDFCSLTVPANTLRDMSSVALKHRRAGGTTAAIKQVALAFGGTALSTQNATNSPYGNFKLGFDCYGTTKQVGTANAEGIQSSVAMLTAARDVTQDQTLTLRGQCNASGDFLAVYSAFVEVTP